MTADELFHVDIPKPAPEIVVPGPRLTERQMLDRLCKRYSANYGNGVRYALAEHVRNKAGFFAERTADFIAVDLWPSSGNAVHGHEVKVSRGDWLTELKDPSKAEAFRCYCDRWWLVVSDPAIVRPGELPDGWGLMAAVGKDKLRAVTRAPRLIPSALPKTFMAALLRANAKTAARLSRQEMTS